MSSDRAGPSFPLQPLKLNNLGALLASTCQPYCKLTCFVWLSVSPLHCPKAVFYFLFFFRNWESTYVAQPGVNTNTVRISQQSNWNLILQESDCCVWHIDLGTEKHLSKKSAVGEAVIKMHPARAGKHYFSFWCSVIQTCDLIKPSDNPRVQSVAAGQRKIFY